MKNKITISVLLFAVQCFAQSNVSNPYASIGKEAKVLTLSNGRYTEFFDNDTLQRIGSVMFNTVTNKIEYFIDENDNYLGGAISPGIRLRYESLHNYTAKLPLLKLESINDQGLESEKIHFIGNSTSESINSGVINGLINEIEGFISQYKAIYPKFIIILTGGDTEFLAKRLKNTIFANSNFLLESLNQTFQYNQND